MFCLESIKSSLPLAVLWMKTEEKPQNPDTSCCLMWHSTKSVASSVVLGDLGNSGDGMQSYVLLI